MINNVFLRHRNTFKYKLGSVPADVVNLRGVDVLK